MEKNGMARQDKGVSRRSFLGGAMGAGALAAAGMLTSCSPSTNGEEGSSGAEGSVSDEEQAFNEAAEPIDPVETPDSWDDEADVVIVGSGGGGTTAAVRLSQEGLSVIVVEKADTTGGETRNVVYFINPGGHRLAEEAEWAFPSYPYDAGSIAEYLNAQYQYTADQNLLKALLTKGPETIDWLESEMGAAYKPTPYLDEVHGLENLWFDTDAVPEAAEVGSGWGYHWLLNRMMDTAMENGATVMTETTVSALVMEDGRVVGVKATDADDNELYLHANKAVLLTAGGFLNNRAMMKKYCPQTVDGTVSQAGWLYNTGECIRMGVGAGADIAGFNTMSCYDGGVLQSEYGEFETEVHPRRDGDRVCAQPWLMINRNGDRVPFVNGNCTGYPFDQDGDYLEGFAIQANIEMSQPGGRCYVVFDSKYRDLITEGAFGQVGPRYATEEYCDIIEEAHTQDGAIVKADTLEEVEEGLGLASGLLTSAVEQWNEACGAGEDYVDMYKYKPEWLYPVDTPPYYGAIIGGENYESKCGLRVNPDMKVMSTEGEPIAGLYAGWHTAGGSQGENTMNGIPFCNIFGNGCLSFTGGYMAADGILANEV